MVNEQRKPPYENLTPEVILQAIESAGPMTLAGEPMASIPEGTSFVTNELAAITASSPIDTFGSTIASDPITARFEMLGPSMHRLHGGCISL